MDVVMRWKSVGRQERVQALAGQASWGSGLTVWVVCLLACLVYGFNRTPLQYVRSAQDKAYYPTDDPQTLVGMVFEHWPLTALVVVLVLILAGQLGRGLGLPGLFRDPPPPDSEQQRRCRGSGYDTLQNRYHGLGTTFWGAVGATLLVAEIWTCVFYFELIQELDQFAPGHFAPPSAVDSPGQVAALFTSVGVGFWDHGDLVRFLVVACPPFLLLVLLAEVLPAPAPGMERRSFHFVTEVALFVAGMAVGVVATFVAAKCGTLLHGPLEWLWGRLYPDLASFGNPFNSASKVKLFRLEEAHPGVTESVKVAITASFSAFALINLAIYVLLTGLFRRSLSPGLGICLLLSFVTVAYSVLAMLSTTGQAVVLLVGLVWFVACNRNPYKYRFPGMADSYDKGRRVDLRALARAMRPPAREFGLQDNVEVLGNWRRGTGEDRPKLVLIATTGGAYRAAFWTTVVLDELGRCLPDFHRHVRLITGASGGMVGAAYYAAAMGPEGPTVDSVTDLLREESGLDSLTPVVRRLLRRDLPRAFLPWPQAHDRGIELEQMWRTLASTFPDLCDGERAGWRPSLIVSPMVVEAGRRLLISNLDLGALAETRPRGLEPPPGATGLEAEVARLYSRSAAEFFRVFPKARPEFRLQTAVRMSATFPFASPAVNLPSEPPRRVVDAGYYDNYGVDLATAWAYEYSDWIRENTSGVALIQIRAYPSETDTLGHLALDGEVSRSASASLINQLRTSFQGLTSPLEGGLSARNWSMRFRNATQLRILDDLFNRPGEPRRFETFVFENFADFAMNWFISDQDIASMRRSIGADPGASTDGERAEAGGRWGEQDHRRVVATLKRMTEDATHQEKDRLIAWWGGRVTVEPAAGPNKSPAATNPFV